MSLTNIPEYKELKVASCQLFDINGLV